VSCVVRPFNTIVGSAAIKESILSMKSMPADGKSNSVTGRNRRSSCNGGSVPEAAVVRQNHLLPPCIFCNRTEPYPHHYMHAANSISGSANTFIRERARVGSFRLGCSQSQLRQRYRPSSTGLFAAERYRC
jgi:hypothetical protein